MKTVAYECRTCHKKISEDVDIKFGGYCPSCREKEDTRKEKVLTDEEHRLHNIYLGYEVVGVETRRVYSANGPEVYIKTLILNVGGSNLVKVKPDRLFYDYPCLLVEEIEKISTEEIMGSSEQKDFSKVEYVEADVGYPGMRLATKSDSHKYVSSENYKELLDDFDQCKKERYQYERKDIVCGQCGKRDGEYKFYCEYCDKSEKEIQKMHLQNAIEQRDARFSIEQIEEAFFKSANNNILGNVVFQKMKKYLTIKQKEGG